MVTRSIQFQQKLFLALRKLALLLLGQRGHSEPYELNMFMYQDALRFAKPGNHLALMFWLAGAVTTTNSIQASGIYRDGAGARALALGGISVGKPDTVLESMYANPAGLSAINTLQFQFGIGAVLPGGKFSNSANPEVRLEDDLNFWPEMALAVPITTLPVTLGLAFIPDAGIGGEWNYLDAPGGINNTSYGMQEHRSEITTWRSAIGGSWQASRSLSLGAALGVVYNRNRLHAPYIFQTYPALQGFKTLLDLKTEGFGVNGMVGLLYQPCQRFSLGLSYQTSTHVNSTGGAHGNAGVQLANLGLGGAQPDFHYDAEVDNVFPQVVSAGFAWQMHERVRSLFQVDWINWGDAFSELEIYLNNGSNNDINGVLGTANIYDVVPLRWEDQLVYRLGLEFAASEAITLRAGYSYGKSPVPDATLTPLTAAIMEHKIAAGAGWKGKQCFVDAAYQYSLPATQSVGPSALQAGEYSTSRTTVNIHTLAITWGVNF